MNSENWPTAELRGERHAIPPLCPNCLQPGTVELRHADEPPMFPVGGGRLFIQTFRYCSGCAEVANAYIASRRKAGLVWLGLLVLLFPIGILVGVLKDRVPGLRDLIRAYSVMPLLFAGMVLYFVLGWAIMRRISRSARERFPMRDGQKEWGLAALITGVSVKPEEAAQGDFIYHVYRAARPEWLKALVQANASLVSDDTFARIVGGPKP